MPSRCFFFLSTGRCGTQWLASLLERAYSDLAVITHQPIGFAYQSSLFHRDFERLDTMLELPAVASHIDTILASQKDIYIETGPTCQSAIPLFIERLGTRVGVVHLIRHPVTTAASLLTHNWYGEGNKSDWFRNCAIHADSPRNLAVGFRHEWSRMSPYERCLFYWTEVHLYAEEIHEMYPGTPFLSVRFEDLIGSDEQLEGLVQFLGLPPRMEVLRGRATVVDSVRAQMSRAVDWQIARRYPEVVQLALRYGYRVEGIPVEALRRRYVMSPIVRFYNFLHLDNFLRYRLGSLRHALGLRRSNLRMLKTRLAAGLGFKRGHQEAIEPAGDPEQ